MSYQINFTETTNPSKPSIYVQDQTLETQSTSLTFVGKNYAGYGQPMAENFLHLLENFANRLEPNHPVQGQLWYDNTPGVESIKVYDSTSWVPVGGVKKDSTRPLNSAVGDLWVDTLNYQLNVYDGTNWQLIGPAFSQGTKTGPEVETIIDTAGLSQSVIALYSNNYRIAIVSSSAFIPKSLIPGFSYIKQGINLSTFKFSSTSSEVTKLWGRASEADALNIGGNTVSASNFLRSDAVSTTNFQLNIRNDLGISLGNNLNYSIYSGESDTYFLSKTAGKSVKFKLTSSDSNISTFTALNIDPSGRVGIGFDSINDGSPQATLDIRGDVENSTLGIRVSGVVYVENQAQSTNINSGSIITEGGLAVKKRANFGESVDVNGTLTIGNVDGVAGAVIIPGPASTQDALITKTYDIGTRTRSFRNIYAETFYGNIEGNVTITSGTLDGNVSGSAGRLKNPTDFRLDGEVVSQTIRFDGTNGTAVFETAISSSHYKKESVNEFERDDMIMLFRPSVPSINPTSTDATGDIRRISRTNFLNSVPVLPVGTILPFAGNGVPPPGFLFCDGSEIPRSDYIDLFEVIGFTYLPQTSLRGKGTFAIPDLRGRFPLGRNNMNNGLQVEKIDSTPSNPSYTNSNPGSVSRVNNNTANVVGGEFPNTLTSQEQGGTDTRILSVKNLPYHKHNLRSSDGTRYYAVNPDGNTQPDEVGGYVGKLHQIGESAQYIPVTGDISTNISQLEQPFNIMNPYLTINYIIYTGKITL